MTLPLTDRQEQLWRYIGSCGRSPSFDEMGAALGLKSKSTIHRLVNALEERGFVKREPNLARTIVAVDPKPAPETDLSITKTSELLAELERRGILLGCAR